MNKMTYFYPKFLEFQIMCREFETPDLKFELKVAIFGGLNASS